MSTTARKWARDQVIGSSSLKHLLKDLADYEQGTGEVFASILTLVESTEMDRKTVVAGIQELVKRGFLKDTGKRVGRTKQVIVYQFVGFEPDIQRAHRHELERRAKSPKNGTLAASGNGAENGTVQVPDEAQEFEGTGCANSTETGTVPKTGPVPFFPGNSPVFPAEQSQKRTTELSLNDEVTHDARAQARRGARARGPEPEPISPEQRLQMARGYWRTTVLSAFMDVIGAEFREHWRKPFEALPQRLQQLVTVAAAPIVDEFIEREMHHGARERTGAAGEAMRGRVDIEAAAVVAMYRQALKPAAAA